MAQWSGIRHQALLTRAQIAGEHLVTSDAVLDAALSAAALVLAPVAPDSSLLAGARAALYTEYQMIVVNDDLPVAQRRFAIAHELGHFHVHAAGFHCAEEDLQLPADGAQPLSGVEVYNPRQRRETEASVFARELLLPAPLLRDRFLAGDRLESLAGEFGLDRSLVAAALATALLERPETASNPSVPAFSLDPSQQQAAALLDAPALVHAGPGTGKTRALVGRIVFLIEEEHVEPAQILALTFSNRAAAEVRERIAGALPGRALAVMVCTFHAFCLDVLRRHAQLAGLPPDFRVIDPTDAALLLEGDLSRLSLDEYASLHDPGLWLPALVQAIGRAKDELVTPERYAARAAAMAVAAQIDEERRAARRAEEAAGVFGSYQQLLLERGLVDFGDLMSKTITVLEAHPAALELLRATHRHIVVDEYQDLNPANLLLLRLLADRGKRLWAVGDPRQAIYRFRGAAAITAAQFANEFPGARVCSLAENYRSREPLVALLQRVAGAMDPSLPPQWRGRPNQETAQPACYRAVAEHEQAEIDGIAGMIRERQRAGCPLGEQAVLCRTNAQADTLAAGLEARGVPVAHLAHFFERPEVRDLLALLAFLCDGEGVSLPRLARHPDHLIADRDVAAILRGAALTGDHFPQALASAGRYPGVSRAGAAGSAALWQRLQPLVSHDDPWDSLTRYLFGGGSQLTALILKGDVAAEQALLAMGQLLNLARSRAGVPDSGPDVSRRAGFLRYVRALVAAHAVPVSLGLDGAGDAVQVLTVHASKGLEFDTVFVPNLATRHFPPQRRTSSVPAPAGMLAEERSPDSEERALLFVAMSRARHILVLSRAERYGSGKQRSSVSPLWSFLEQAAADLLPVPARWLAAPAPEHVAEPDTAGTPVEGLAQVSRPGPRQFTARAIEQYLACPRSYYYQYVLGLPEPRADMAYRRLHDCIRQTASWLRDRMQTGRGCDEEALWEEFSRRWQASCPERHVHEVAYRAAASSMLRRLWDEMRAQPPGPAWQQEITVSLQAATVRLPLDFGEISGEGLVLARYRTGKPRAGHAKEDRRLTLYREAATQAGERVATLEIRYLSDGTRTPVSDEPARSREHLEEINHAVESIVSGMFPATREGDRCARCRYNFACPC